MNTYNHHINKQANLTNMSIDTLKQLAASQEFGELTDEQRDILEVDQMQMEQIHEQRELLATNPEVRLAIGSALRIRMELHDPIVASVDYDELMNYEDFDGARQALRMAFDFRTKEDGSYGERQEGDERAERYFYPGLTDEVSEQINVAAEILKLSGDVEPEITETDTALILGGAGRSIIDRTAYAKELIDAGKMKPNKIVILASERPVNDAERARAGEFAATATTEFELGIVSYEEVWNVKVDRTNIVEWVDHSIDAFPLEDQKGIPFRNRVHKVIHAEGDPESGRPDAFFVSSAIVTDPLGDATKDGHPIKIIRNRANTDDTFETFSRLDEPKPKSRITMITKTIFLPFQKTAAVLRLAKRGVIVDAASYDTTHFGANADKPHAQGMEMLSLADALSKYK